MPIAQQSAASFFLRSSSSSHVRRGFASEARKDRMPRRQSRDAPLRDLAAGFGGDSGKSFSSGSDEYDAPMKPHDAYPRMVDKKRLSTGWSNRFLPWEADKPGAEGQRAADVGYEVPYKFRVIDPDSHSERGGGKKSDPTNRDSSPRLTYTDFAGNRFPTLDTAENYTYWKDTGLDRFLPRVFPLQIPTARKLNPALREYIYFLHSLDPQRFTPAKIGERYGLKESTVRRVVTEFGTLYWMQKSGLSPARNKRVTRGEAVLQEKERMYNYRLGWDEMGDEEIAHEAEDNEFNGWKNTFDWIYRQSVKVEMMSAFPLKGKRDPMPKRVDVDMVVRNDREHKVMNWIDPYDKVVF